MRPKQSIDPFDARAAKQAIKSVLIAASLAMLAPRNDGLGYAATYFRRGDEASPPRDGNNRRITRSRSLAMAGKERLPRRLR